MYCQLRHCGFKSISGFWLGLSPSIENESCPLNPFNPSEVVSGRVGRFSSATEVGVPDGPLWTNSEIWVCAEIILLLHVSHQDIKDSGILSQLRHLLTP